MSGTMISTATSAMMVERLKTLALAGRIRQLDLQFARLVADLGGSPELVLGAALTCFELGRGHVCLPLEMLATGSLRPFGLDPQQSRDLLGIWRILPAGPPCLQRVPWLVPNRMRGSPRAGRCGSGTGGSTSPATTILNWGWPAICAP